MSLSCFNMTVSQGKISNLFQHLVKSLKPDKLKQELSSLINFDKPLFTKAVVFPGRKTAFPTTTTTSFCKDLIVIFTLCTDSAFVLEASE